MMKKTKGQLFLTQKEVKCPWVESDRTILNMCLCFRAGQHVHTSAHTAEFQHSPRLPAPLCDITLTASGQTFTEITSFLGLFLPLVVGHLIYVVVVFGDVLWYFWAQSQDLSGLFSALVSVFNSCLLLCHLSSLSSPHHLFWWFRSLPLCIWAAHWPPSPVTPSPGARLQSPLYRSCLDSVHYDERICPTRPGFPCMFSLNSCLYLCPGEDQSFSLRKIL